MEQGDLQEKYSQLLQEIQKQRQIDKAMEARIELKDTEIINLLEHQNSLKEKLSLQIHTIKEMQKPLLLDSTINGSFKHLRELISIKRRELAQEEAISQDLLQKSHGKSSKLQNKWDKGMIECISEQNKFAEEGFADKHRQLSLSLLQLQELQIRLRESKELETHYEGEIQKLSKVLSRLQKSQRSEETKQSNTEEKPARKSGKSSRSNQLQKRQNNKMSHSQCSSCNSTSTLVHQDPSLLCLNCYNRKLAEERQMRERRERQQDIERESQNLRRIQNWEEQQQEMWNQQRLQSRQEAQRASQHLEEIFQQRRPKAHYEPTDASDEYWRPDLAQQQEYRQALLSQIEEKRQRQAREREEDMRFESNRIERNNRMMEEGESHYYEQLRQQRQQVKQELENQLKEKEDARKREWLDKQYERFDIDKQAERYQKEVEGFHRYRGSRKEVWRCGNCSQNTDPGSLSQWG